MEEALAKNTRVRTVTHFYLQVLNSAVLSWLKNRRTKGDREIEEDNRAVGAIRISAI
jgi:hypothetical protein